MARELRRLLIAPERLTPERLTPEVQAPEGPAPEGNPPDRPARLGQTPLDPTIEGCTSGTVMEATPLLSLEPGERHYLARVLRYRPGDRLAVIDGQGRLWSAVLVAGDRIRLEQPAGHPLERTAPAVPLLELALAVPKRDADLVWRIATELGADRLQPLIASRSAVRERMPLERWRTIVREATEQCERLWLPQLQPAVTAADWLARPPRGLGLLATSRNGGLALPSQVLDQLGAAPEAVTLAIGPEGGWTPQEEAVATAAGWRCVSLGEGILRCSTAAVAGLAQLVAWRTLSAPSFPWPSP